MLSILPSIFVLGLAAAAAAWPVGSRPSPSANVVECRSAARVLTYAVSVQSIHFVEEVATGFHERFPALFGLPAMPLSFFIGFNLAWIGIWIASISGLQSERSLAFFAAWFLAIAAMLNGVAHPLLAIAVGGYFPGLVTSPFIGAVGVLLWRRLQEATWHS